MNSPVMVTIGMCVKNSEDTIRETIDSVISQNYPRRLTELIVVDGFSKDRTVYLIENALSAVDLEYRVFFEKQGLGRARQIVVDKAKGEYVIWVDGDMKFSPDFVRKLVGFMEQNPNVGIAKGKYELSSGSNPLSTLEIYSRVADKMVDYSQEKARSKALGTSACIYRLKAIRQVGGFDTNIKGYGEDWDAEYRIRLAGWKLWSITVYYQDYERYGLTWRELWQRYRRRGYDLHDVLQKHSGVVKLYAMLPLGAFVFGLLKCKSLYQMKSEKIVFLLPLQKTFKMLAWWLGYLNRSFDLLFGSSAVVT